MNRRSLLLGLGAALAAPAIVKAENLMKIAAVRQAVSPIILSMDVGGIEFVTVNIFDGPHKLLPASMFYGPAGDRVPVNAAIGQALKYADSGRYNFRLANTFEVPDAILSGRWRQIGNKTSAT